MARFRVNGRVISRPRRRAGRWTRALADEPILLAFSLSSAREPGNRFVASHQLAIGPLLLPFLIH